MVVGLFAVVRVSRIIDPSSRSLKLWLTEAAPLVLAWTAVGTKVAPVALWF